jgi:3-oxoacyl-[acyl-carrier protein] reductase
LKQKGYHAQGYKVDISSEQDVQHNMQLVETNFSKIDIMINSAGIVGPTSTKITDYAVEEYDKIYAVNLRGAFLMTKYAIKAMEKNNYGRVLLIASIAGKEGNPFMAGYSSMKAGVIGLVKGIGKEYAQTGITVNGLAPAVIKTAMNEKTAPEQLAYMTAKIPMGRLGTIEEVASIASWIVSKEASFNTGFVLIFRAAELRINSIIFIIQAAAFHGIIVASHSCTFRKAVDSQLSTVDRNSAAQECDARKA